MNTKQLEKEYERLVGEQYRSNKAPSSSSGSSGDSVKATLLESLYAGEINREAAKAIYEARTGKTWDIYNDPATADGKLPSVSGSGGGLTEDEAYIEYLKLTGQL